MQEVKKHCVLNNADFSAFIERVDTAQDKFADQSADEFKKLWSHSDDVTLFGGHGGRVECGWENVAGRLEWSSSTYRQADRGSEFISGCVCADFAYVVRRCRFGIQQDMIAAFEHNQASVWNETGEFPALFEGYSAILPRMQHQCGAMHFRCNVTQVHFVEHAQKPSGVGGRC